MQNGKIFSQKQNRTGFQGSLHEPINLDYPHPVHLTQNSETSPQLIWLNLEGGGMLLEDMNVLNFLCQ